MSDLLRRNAAVKHRPMRNRSAKRLLVSLALTGATLALAPAAGAQAVTPKQCVAVARDPDDAIRALAARVERAFAAAPSVRVVADDRTRATLRGEASDDPALAPIAAARRALTLADSDVAPLNTIADALGCASITVLSSTPRGFSLRRFDVIARGYDAATEAQQWTDEALRARLALPEIASSAPAATPTASAANSTPTTVTPPVANTSANTSASATPTASAAGPTIARAAPRSSATQPADPRVTVAPPAQAPRASTPVWAWVIAGVAGAGLVGAFIAAQSIGPSVPLVRVSGPGTAP
jgi:hypothetical protein